jgi:D-lactate dehydrogenase (cytochrome)
MSFIDKLASLYPDDRFSTQADQLNVASHDESSFPGVKPMAVVWPLTTEEVVKTVKLCAETGTPITSRGAGSALQGSSIPVEGGIVVDLSRMTQIVNYWPEDLQVEVEPGIIYDHLNDYLKRDGLFFPPSPGGSGDIATVGGMVSTNASGIYSVKYGGTRSHLLALEVVTGTGEVLRLGNRAVKRSSGYNLVDLVSGSEGTLALVTKITLRLTGIPEGRKQSAYFFESDLNAATAVSEMLKYGIDLAAVEFLDRQMTVALNKLKGYGLKEAPLLFLEFHGPEAVLDSNLELADEVCRELGAQPLTLGEGQNPWEIRHWASDAIKHYQAGLTTIRNDVAFPISKLPEMVTYCHELGQQYGIMVFTFGHVGMGLLHAQMLADEKDEKQWKNGWHINHLIIEKGLELGGTISGEHGVGVGHKDLFLTEHGPSVELMRKIKQQFDPKGILNPGKIFDL